MLNPQLFSNSESSSVSRSVLGWFLVLKCFRSTRVKSPLRMCRVHIVSTSFVWYLYNIYTGSFAAVHESTKCVPTCSQEVFKVAAHVRPNFRFLWRRDGKICPNLCMSSGPICISCTGDRYCPYIHLICMVVLSDILDSGGVAWWSRRKGSCHRKVLPRVRSPSNVYRWNQSLWASNVTWWFADHLFTSLFLQHCTSKLVSLGIPVTLPGGVFRPNRIFKDFQEVNLKTKRNEVKAFQLASMCIFFSCGFFTSMIFGHIWINGEGSWQLLSGADVEGLSNSVESSRW